ncbi:MAG: hypothetical protein CMP10_01660, partial [Zetaproteobacteria bacterium]|nr:hypothetical protein [Pseudobdellovibrionaceae bacterium]
IREKERTQIFHNTSHELRTPLNGIIGFLDLVRKKRYGEVPPAASGQIGKALNLANSLKSQINTILDLAKSKSGELKHNIQTYSLEELKNEADNLAEGLQLRRSDLSYESSLTAAKPEFIGDQEKTFTIIRNLLGNAFKFKDISRSNHIKLILYSDSINLRIVVEDTGIGIPEGSKHKIFEEFGQIEGDARRSYEGTGLGLSLVNNLVNLLGGRIECDSKEGQGSTFTVVLPNQPESAITITAKEINSEPSIDIDAHEDIAEENLDDDSELNISEQDSHTLSILVIDDSEMNCEVITEILKIDGYQISSVLAGKDGLDHMRSNKPDMLLLDMMMPGMSGEDVLNEMKNDDFLRDIPAIIITARASEEDRIYGLNIGADDYLPKPIISRELRLRVHNLLFRQRLIKEKEQHRFSKNLLVQNEKLAQIGQLVASVGHEIANPIQLSNNNCYLLERRVKTIKDYIKPLLDDDDETTVKFSKDLNDQLEKIAEINDHNRFATNKLQEISGALRTQSRLDTKPVNNVDLNEIVRESLIIVGGRIRHIEVDLGLSELTPVICYRSRIGQIITNLLANAADAVHSKKQKMKANHKTLTGKIAISSIILRYQGKDGVLISIADNGDGVDTALREKIFEKFYTTKEAGKGTGLGLSMCLEIVDQHGGNIEISDDNELGGARFEVWLPTKMLAHEVA